MSLSRKRKEGIEIPLNKRKKTLHYDANTRKLISDLNSEIKVENEFDNLFEEEADLTIKEALQDIKLDIFDEDLDGFGNELACQTEHLGNCNHKSDTPSISVEKTSNLKNSPKVLRIIDKQKEALKLIQIALMKFESVTKDLQELVEFDIEEAEADLEDGLDSTSTVKIEVNDVSPQHIDNCLKDSEGQKNQKLIKKCASKLPCVVLKNIMDEKSTSKFIKSRNEHDGIICDTDDNDASDNVPEDRSEAVISSRGENHLGTLSSRIEDSQPSTSHDNVCKAVNEKTFYEKDESSNLTRNSSMNHTENCENVMNEEIQASVSVSSKRKLKPMRPCVYCKKYFTQITRHISRRHKSEKEVKYALSLPREERIKELDKLRKKGMFCVNIEKLRTEKNPELLRERCDNIKTGYAVCNGCHGIYGKRYIYSHKKNCDSYSGTIMLQNHRDNCTEDEKAFKEKVLDKFRLRDDEATKLCLKDPFVLKVGQDLFTNAVVHPKKKATAGKRVRSLMKLLGRLIVEFTNEGRKRKLELKSKDIFNVQYFPIFELALHKLSSTKINDCDGDDGSNTNAKEINSTLLCLRVVVNQFVSTMSYSCAIEKNEKMQNEVSHFSRMLSERKKFLFGEVASSVKCRRKTTLGNPTQLSTEENVIKLEDLRKLAQLSAE